MPIKIPSTKYANENTKTLSMINKIKFTLFFARQFFWVLFAGLKIWWRPKNDKYEVWLLVT